ncbi:MAG: MobA/MobL family protein [Oscillospiraceae bacterium]|nr:MobA/MobL family protein [Oscillospiraceae bacterium]
MAIYHCSVKIIGRSSGRSSVAAAAYRAGEKITNERDGLTHNYSQRYDVVHSEIILPENALSEFENRAVLWNAVEKSETRKDSQTAREVEIALPVELDFTDNLDVVRQYVNENFVSHGMCADVAIHGKNDGVNPHAHIMLTTRDVTVDGFGGKNRDWNDKALLEKWRENWASVCNEKLKSKGIDERIDHRTLLEQGVLREPTIHLGRGAIELEKKGHESDRAKINNEIANRNAMFTPEKVTEYLHELREAFDIADKEIERLKFAERSGEAEKINKTASIVERLTLLKENRDIMSVEGEGGIDKKIEELKEQRAKFELEYKAHSVLTGTKLEPQPRQQSQSTREFMRERELDRRLNNVTQSEKKIILSNAPPEFARGIILKDEAKTKAHVILRDR